MHLPFIVHIHARQMYVTITCTQLKCALHFIRGFISWLYWYWTCRTMALWNYFEGWTTWAKRVSSKHYTFSCYRASQSRDSKRWPPFTTCVKPSVKHIVISVHLNSLCYLIPYTRLFTKLNFFEILLYVTILLTKFSRSTVILWSLILLLEVIAYIKTLVARRGAAVQDGAWKANTIASYIPLRLQILVLGTCQKYLYTISFIFTWRWYYTVLVLLLDLCNINIVWPKVAWPDLFFARGITAFSISAWSGPVWYSS